MTSVMVNPGVCGFIATIAVKKIAKRKVKIEITSDCEMVTRLAESLVEVNTFDVLKHYTDSGIYQAATRCELHPACPIPVAIIKAVEVGGGLAIPRDVVIHFENSE